MDEEEKNTTQEKMDVRTNSNQQEEEEFKLWQKIYVWEVSDKESESNSDLSDFSYYS